MSEEVPTSVVPDAAPVRRRSAPVPTRRRLPRWRDLEPFLVTRPWHREAAERRLGRCVTVDDVERLARRRVPGAVFDYVHSGAESEVSLDRNRQAFRDLELRPTSYGQVGDPDTSSTLLGRSVPFPLALGPTGYTRLSHHSGERAVAAAAAAAGVPYTLSTYGTTSIGDVAAAAPQGRNWYQFYVMRDRAVSEVQLREAKAHGYEAAMMTIDTSTTGLKVKDVRNGFAIPPQLTARTFADLARHPGWVANILTTEPLRFATFPEGSPYGRWGMSNVLREQGLRPTDVTWLKEAFEGPVVVKGVLSVEDAVQSVDAGADAVVLSNHGGRQLDRSPVPLELLPAVVDAVGDRAEVYIDSGVRSGADVVAALALGAKAALIGRPYLYGLMVGGQAGVDTVIDIIASEMVRTMSLLGVSTVSELGPQHVRLRA